MFKGKLFDFQELHEVNLLNKFSVFDEVVLSAPTGSGKTVLASKFIVDYLELNPNTVFLWLCPGAGMLHKQSSDSFSAFVDHIDYGDVFDFISESDPSGKVYFINWDKINRASNVALREGDYNDLNTALINAHLKGIEIFVLIDEEHKYQETANMFLGISQPKNVLRISATPFTETEYREVIHDGEVIEAGLISTGISINEGLIEEITNNDNIDDDLLLLELADKKRKQIIEQYNLLGLSIRPLVMVQFPNGHDDWIERIRSKLSHMGYTKESGLVTEWFSNSHPEEPKELKKLDGSYAFLLFKQAVSTGWDCPRAKILVKLREGGTEPFNIQTIGRIRRTPERKHYGIGLLDNCYVYTLDSQFQSGLTASLSDSFYTYEYKLKSEFPELTLTKSRLVKNDEYTPDDIKVVEVLRNKFLSKYPPGENGHLNTETLINRDGYIFGSVLKAEALVGIARTVNDLAQLRRFNAGEHEIDLHNDGFIIRDARRKIAAAVGADERIVNTAMSILFAPLDEENSLLSEDEILFEKESKLIPNMTLREFNAFEINNLDKIVSLFQDITPGEIGELEEADIETKDWKIPPKQLYKHHKKLSANQIMEKNVFDSYGDNILLKPNRSDPEILFETWAENSNKVKWIYKNGDKGDDYFSLVYRDRFKRAHFYPDYVVVLSDGTIFVVETKGGVNQADETENIDKRASAKFEALREFGEKYPEIKWGFVRPIGNELYISNTIWTESMINRPDVWKSLDEYISKT